MYNLCERNQIAADCPENLLFIQKNSVLAEMALDNDYSENVRISCAAELLIRHYLNSYCNESEAVFDCLFHAGEWREMEKNLKQDFLTLPHKTVLHDNLWQSASVFSEKCDVAVRSRLEKLLFNTDGFIPVYLEENAFFIPFHFEEAKGSLPLIGDSDRQSISGWEKYYIALFGNTPEYRCIVHCSQKHLPVNPAAKERITLSGSSLMLPLWIAYQRKKGNLPEYNHLRLFATGEIKNNRLVPVQVEEKLKGMKNAFANAWMLFPESSQCFIEDFAAIRLSCFAETDAILEDIKQIIEAKGLVVPTFQYAMTRLNALEEDIRDKNFNKWQRMLERLNTNAEAITEWRDPEKYLLCLMLKSSIYCHMGDTAEALRWNEQAKNTAREYKFEKQLRRLEIEELVEFQDKEDFSSILALMNTLGENIEKTDDDDLLMRYHGTVGQSHCYGFLAGIEGFSREDGLKHFRMALHHACNLNSELDIAQDLNYIYLWYVLFDTGSQNAEKAYQNACEHIERNLISKPKGRQKNKFFLQRLKMMSLYRQLLNGKCISVDDETEKLNNSEAIPWLKALVCKYMGALTASRGQLELASGYFNDAIRFLEPDISNDIIAWIQMTVYAEAYRSLKEVPYKNKALDIIKIFSDKYPATANLWKKYLNNSAEFPGLKYWY